MSSLFVRSKYIMTCPPALECGTCTHHQVKRFKLQSRRSYLLDTMLGCLLCLCVRNTSSASLESRFMLCATPYTVARCRSTETKALFAACNGDTGIAEVCYIERWRDCYLLRKIWSLISPCWDGFYLMAHVCQLQ